MATGGGAKNGGDNGITDGFNGKMGGDNVKNGAKMAKIGVTRRASGMS